MRILTDKKFKECYINNHDVQGLALRKQFVCDQVKKINETKRKIDFVLSTEKIDRMGDSISLFGWDLSAYKKNPVVLFAHNGSQPPIAKASNVKKNIKEKTLVASAEFTSRDMNPFGFSIFQMYVGGFMKAVSVGFRPVEFDFSEDKKRPLGIDFKKQELLEFSAVPVPANPDALVAAKSCGIDMRPIKEWAEEILDTWGEQKELIVPKKDVEFFYTKIDDKTNYRVPAEVQDALLAKNLESVRRQCAEEKKKEEEAVVKEEEVKETIDKEDKGTISFAAAHPGGTPKQGKDASWDGGAEVKKASVDDLKVMSAWRANKPAAELTKSDFKFPHHVAGGSHSVNFKGTTAAIGALNGARGGTSIPDKDRKGVYNHLAKHVRDDFKAEPAPLKSLEDLVKKDIDEVVDEVDQIETRQSKDKSDLTPDVPVEKSGDEKMDETNDTLSENRQRYMNLSDRLVETLDILDTISTEVEISKKKLTRKDIALIKLFGEFIPQIPQKEEVVQKELPKEVNDGNNEENDFVILLEDEQPQRDVDVEQKEDGVDFELLVDVVKEILPDIVTKVVNDELRHVTGRIDGKI